MKYISFVSLRRVFDYNNIGTKAWYLKTATICSNNFSTRPIGNSGTQPLDSNKENILHSRSKRFSWLSLARNGKKKADDLIPKIITEIEAHPFFFKHVQKICDDLRRIFPSAQVTVFGSAGSNLALQNADIDIGLRFKGIDEISTDIIYTVKDKLWESKLFKRAHAIFAHVPIIKCVHCNGVSCDISCTDHIAVHDSELVRFILSIDNRIRPLLLILKFLLKKEGLLFNTHCLVVMTIFFLQVLDKPLVPPISYLQDAATERKMFGGWDVSFTREIEKLPRVNNQSSVIELLQKFFEFYAAFEFAFQVISVFTGKFYLKPIFANVDLLPEHFYLFKRKVVENEFFRFNCNAYMCIQGFFDHSVNISKNFKEKNVKSFQDYCRINAAMGQELLGGNESEEHKLEFLIRLFQQNKTDENEKTVNDPLKDVVIVLQNVCLQDINSSPDDFRNQWWKYVLDNILEILRDVMDGQVSVEFRKLENESSDLVEEYIMSCEIPYWELATKIRKKAEKSINFDKNLTPIEKQKIISDCLKKTLLEEVEKKSYKFNVICGFEKNPTRVRLKFEPKYENKKSDGLLLQACSYLSKHIPKWMP